MWRIWGILGSCWGGLAGWRKRGAQIGCRVVDLKFGNFVHNGLWVRETAKCSASWSAVLTSSIHDSKLGMIFRFKSQANIIARVSLNLNTIGAIHLTIFYQGYMTASPLFILCVRDYLNMNHSANPIMLRRELHQSESGSRVELQPATWRSRDLAGEYQAGDSFTVALDHTYIN